MASRLANATLVRLPRQLLAGMNQEIADEKYRY